MRAMPRLFVLLSLFWGPPSPAVPAEEDWQPVGAPEFVIRFSAQRQQAAAGTCRLTLRSEGGTKSLAFELTANELRLVSVTGPSSRVAWAQPVENNQPTTRDVWLLVKTSEIRIGLDGRCAGSIPEGLDAGPSWRWEAGTSWSLTGTPRIQPLSPISLADDFMREANSNLFWETLGGEWAVQASSTPSQAANAFRLFARGNSPPALAMNQLSHWFWHDLRLGVSFQSSQPTATVGIVFAARDARSFHLFRWSAGRTLQLVRIRPDQEEVLAAYSLDRDPASWYRLEAVARGETLAGYLDGQKRLQARDPLMFAGHAGLWVSSSEGAWLDDFLAESFEREPPDRLENPFGPAEGLQASFRGKEFATDPRMVLWAHPRSNWADSPGGLSWHVSRFFQDARFEWQTPAAPLREGEVCLFGQRGRAGAGYQFQWKNTVGTLRKNGREIGRTGLPEGGLSSVSFSAGNQHVHLKVDGREACLIPDTDPLRDGEIGARLGSTLAWDLARQDWRDTALVESSHRVEYLFDAAPVAWAPACGVWQSFNRWACVPMWSFFGGRGPDRALLWNKRRVRGDFDLMAAFAPMEGTPQRIHFAYPVNLNLVFAADGYNLDTGYNLVFGAQDIPTRLYRSDQQVAEHRARVIPRFRFDDDRVYTLITQTWQRVQVRRRGGRVQVLAARFDRQGQDVGMETLLEYTDPQPLPGECFGLWCWGQNGMAVARVSLSFQESPGPSLLPVPLPAHAEPQSSRPDTLLTVNRAPGGEFRCVLSPRRLAPADASVIRFRYRVPAGVDLGLFVRRRLELAQFAFAGSESYRPGSVPLGRLDAVTDGQWHEIEIPLLEALARACPDDPQRPLDEIFLASPMANLEQTAGLGINRAGCRYEISQVRFLPSPPPHLSPPLPPPQVCWNGHHLLDDFEAGLGEWMTFGGPSGALLWRDPQGARTGRYGLRLFQHEVGGTAGVRISSTPFNARRFPLLSFDYLFPPDLQINLVVHHRQQWYEIGLTANDSTWPVLARVGDILADNQWHTARIDLESALGQVASRDGPLWIDGLYLADTWTMSNMQGLIYRMDNFCWMPALPPETPLEFRLSLPGVKPQAFAHLFDRVPASPVPTTPTGQGDLLQAAAPRDAAWLHVAVQHPDGRWSPPAHVPILVRPGAPAGPDSPDREPARSDEGPPSAPRISYVPSQRLCHLDFEWGDDPDGLGETLGEVGIRRGAWVIPCQDDAATGSGCVEILNLNTFDFFSAFLHQRPYDLRRYPRIAFDYKFESPGCAVNLTGLLNKEMFVVEWLSRCQPGGYFTPFVVGRVAEGIQDGRWHHIDFSLLDFVTASGRAQHPALPLLVEQINTWAMSSGLPVYRNPLGARLKIDNFTLYSPQGREPAFTWSLTRTRQTGDRFTLAFDQQPDSTPPDEPLVSTDFVKFSDVKPGRWFFHVRARDGQGRRGPVSHTTIEVE
ncbi:MAG: hypothetical protein HYU36_06985 [Planctomycetes bacterium]|nr:hypothetical protein [Planctomycetota bacterium]